MEKKAMFNAASTSYSQFLHREGRGKIHSLTDSHDLTMDIDFFRQAVCLHYQHVYANKKWQSHLYRYIFLAFGIIFFILGTLIFFKTTNYAFAFYFKNYRSIKDCIDLFCFILSSGAFALAYNIHPEKEAISYLIGKVEKELSSPAKHLQIEFNTIFANLSLER